MKNRIMAYSYLATLSNSNKHGEYLSSFRDLVKYAIFEKSKESAEYLIEDIQEKMKLLYDINMPYAVIEFVISNYIDNEEIMLTTDGAIITSRLNLDEYYEKMNQSEYDISFLEEDFNHFLRENGVDANHSITELVDAYKDNLLINEYREDIDDDKFTHHMKYLTMLEKDYSKKKIFQNLLLGALITVAILDGQNMKDAFKGNILLLDTSFIISLLGFHSKVSNETCQLVTSLAQNLGFEFKVFDQTIQEASNLLKETAEKLRSDGSPSLIMGNEITKACYLNPHVDANDLDRISSNLLKEIGDRISCKSVLIERFRTKVEKSSLYKYYLDVYKKDPISAFHDTAAILYVESCRGKNISTLDKAKCWFVQDKRNSSNGIRNKNGYINERISSHDLLVLLWMNSPEIINFQQASEIEFMKMVSIAKESRSPSIVDIEKFEENYRKYCTLELKPEELARLRMRIINASIEEIEELNNTEPVIFNSRIREIIIEQDRENTEKVASYEYELDQKETALSEKSQLVEFLSDENKSKDEKIKNQDDQIKRLLDRDTEELKILFEEKSEVESDINTLSTNINEIITKTQGLKKKIRLITIVTSIVLLVIIAIKISSDNSAWSVLEPLAWEAAFIITIINMIISYLNDYKKKNIYNLIDIFVSFYKWYLTSKYDNPEVKKAEKEKELAKINKRIGIIKSVDSIS